MICDQVLDLIALYYYRELTPAEEEAVEAHIHECAGCTAAFERQEALARALDRRRVEPTQRLMEDCRADLMGALRGGTQVVAIRPAGGPLATVLEVCSGAWASLGAFRQPLTAVALVALGFFGARLTPGQEPASHEVRSISADNSGAVEIQYDEVRHRVVSGRLGDRDIQRLVMAASREENPAVRVESLDLLKNEPSVEARAVLLGALANDSNDDVRLKALEGLRPMAADAAVRHVLAQVLAGDGNPAVRMQAVDMLTARPDDAMVGVLQNLVQREDKGYVRSKLEQALQQMNASIGTF